MTAWLGIVSAEHVARGVALGIVQTNHGKRTGLARMRPGDGLIYYSPQRRLGENDPVRSFTAVGRIADEEIWQADEGGPGGGGWTGDAAGAGRAPAYRLEDRDAGGLRRGLIR